MKAVLVSCVTPSRSSVPMAMICALGIGIFLFEMVFFKFSREFLNVKFWQVILPQMNTDRGKNDFLI